MFKDHASVLQAADWLDVPWTIAAPTGFGQAVSQSSRHLSEVWSNTVTACRAFIAHGLAAASTTSSTGMLVIIYLLANCHKQFVYALFIAQCDFDVPIVKSSLAFVISSWWNAEHEADNYAAVLAPPPETADEFEQRFKDAVVRMVRLA